MTQKYKEYSYDALQFELAVRAQLINEQSVSAQVIIDELSARERMKANEESSKAPEQLELFDK